MAEPGFSFPKALRASAEVKISVVVPVWNGLKYLKSLLESLRQQTRQADEVLVVDNGSADGAGEFAEQWGARVVRFAENQGFAAAVNRGVKESSGNHFAILNSDVELEPRWMELLAEAIARTSASFATGLIVSARNPGVIDASWDLVSKAGMPWRVGSGFPGASIAFGQERTIGIAPFTAILLRRELWEEVGPLDERFESYLEDVDFGLRCVTAGRSGIYVPPARCKHFGSATLGRWSGQSVRRMSRNQVFLVRKYISRRSRRRWWWKILAGQALWGCVAAKHGAGGPWLRGKWEGWNRRHEFQNAVCCDQALEQQERQILDLQQELGFDSYWRWYKRLTDRASEAE